MTISLVILLIFLGLLLVLAEIFVLPGVGVAGIIGLILMIAGVVIAYNLDSGSGHISLAVSIVLCAGLTLLALRSDTWSRFSLKDNIEGVSTEFHADIAAGDRGKAVTRLNPYGKARFGGKLYEVHAPTQFIDPDTTLEIVNIEGTKITVKPVDDA